MSSLYGWTGKILRVDLSSGTTTTIETADYVPAYVGGLGIAARIAWDEIGPDVGPYDAENVLFLMVGPLTGTTASGGGRVVVAGIAPQQRPSVFSRSGMGGHWGAELKYAGYDGIAIVGQADEPAYLWVHDGEAELRDAAPLWGLGTFATTAALRNRHGTGTRVVSCGPAGENLCRIACIQTETGNVAGQGGYGAVMGSKKLKAIAVRGTGGVHVADPDRLLDLSLRASREGLRHQPPQAARGRLAPKEMTYRRKKCGFCATDCSNRLYMAAPGETISGAHNVNYFCYGFETGIGGQVEAAAMAGDLGLNGWEITYGVIPWLQLCKQHGLIDRLDDLDIPVPDREIEYLRDIAPYSAEFITALLFKIAHREGELGDALADGTCYAAHRLFAGRGAPLLDRIYPRRAGQTHHWDAHWIHGIYFPFWLTAALQWSVETRDPASDCTHAYATHMLSYLPKHGPHRGPLTPEQARAVCAKVYGEPDVCDPSFSYDKPETKAIPAIYHHDQGMLVESLVLCDREHARVFSLESDDYAADTELAARLFSACTGYETSKAWLDRAGERIFNLLRAIDVRNYGRSRNGGSSHTDWATMSSFARPDLTEGIVLDLERFSHMLDTYYELRGWNPANGWPTRARLEMLGLGDVADELAHIGKLG